MGEIPIEIQLVSEQKKRYLDLLLLADEQEDMIDRYLERGDLFALFDNGLKSVCVVTREGEGCCELKNLATDTRFQKQGYAGTLLEYVCRHYACRYKTMLVGTGDSPLILPFYEHHGFKYSHRVKDFFTIHYDHPIIEDGILLTDMVYLKKSL